MNANIDNMISRSVRRASGLALVLMMACSPAMAAGKPNSPAPTLVDAWLPVGMYGVYVDVTTGDLCDGYNPLCKYTAHVSFSVSDQDGIRAFPVQNQARVAILRNVRFDEANASLVGQAFVKYASGPIRYVQFTDTLLVNVNGEIYKVGFVQCHYDPDDSGLQLPCVATTFYDNEDDGGNFTGDSGLRMSVLALQ